MVSFPELFIWKDDKNNWWLTESSLGNIYLYEAIGIPNQKYNYKMETIKGWLGRCGDRCRRRQKKTRTGGVILDI